MVITKAAFTVSKVPHQHSISMLTAGEARLSSPNCSRNVGLPESCPSHLRPSYLIRAETSEAKTVRLSQSVFQISIKYLFDSMKHGKEKKSEWASALVYEAVWENQMNVIYSSFSGYSFFTRFGYQCFLGCFGKPHTKQLPCPTLRTTGLATSTKHTPGYTFPQAPQRGTNTPTHKASPA